MEKGELSVHCCWERKLVQPLCTSVRRLLEKLKTGTPWPPASPLLAICVKETKTLIQNMDILKALIATSVFCHVCRELQMWTYVLGDTFYLYIEEWGGFIIFRESSFSLSSWFSSGCPLVSSGLWTLTWTGNMPLDLLVVQLASHRSWDFSASVIKWVNSS